MMHFVFHLCDFTVWHSYSLWLNSNMARPLYGALCCPSVWGFEESAQEPTVRFNMQSSGFSDVQSNEASYSNQSTVALSDFPTVSCR
jgi:hypothetical protein